MSNSLIRKDSSVVLDAINLIRSTLGSWESLAISRHFLESAVSLLVDACPFPSIPQICSLLQFSSFFLGEGGGKLLCSFCMQITVSAGRQRMKPHHLKHYYRYKGWLAEVMRKTTKRSAFSNRRQFMDSRMHRVDLRETLDGQSVT